MAWLTSLLIVAQVVCAIAIIVLVLLQQGKGADMGAAFGGGASGSLFGATGSANFLSRATAVAATIFFVATLGLAFVAGAQRATGAGPASGVMGNVPTGQAPAKGESAPPPGVPAPAAAPGAAPAASGTAPAGVPAPASGGVPAPAQPGDAPKK